MAFERDNDWQLRHWPETGRQILIEETGEPDAGGFLTTCLYGVRDYTNDGWDDVATWCRTVGRRQKKLNETVSLYTISSEGPAKRTLTGNDAHEITARLCQENTHAGRCR
jgi:hypothetical protein